ncbi:M28 family metallopeptidase [Alkaliphilus peptidifermentans]|uniref:Peptidase family M28 n=1 Tax=Alkaliphilus peptidifermentans DSM 18978 TaxID=1120976 RepID=A0A1G5F2C2_9FIRM|nr:M28 family metallopeptidase [Alkaliphilus peptidifermentans]SCY33373.1 Peptidase family M28 [Alkaliphilus peptidifermentans DSM 18978]
MVGCVQTPPASTDFVFSINEDLVNGTNAMEIIEELTSEAYSGRLTGTEGNEMAVQYIENYFEEIGLESPSGLEGYRQAYKQKVLINKSKPVIGVTDEEGNIIKEFDFLLDYRIITSQEEVKIQGETTAEMIIIEKAEEINDENDALAGKILLVTNDTIINNSNGPFDILERVSELNSKIAGIIIHLDNRKEGYYIVSTTLGDISANYNEAYNNENGPIMAYFSDEAFEELTQAALEGRSLHMKVDYSYTDDIMNNVVGVISGRDEENEGYIIVGAHLDHVGDNQDGTYNPGALDNASGTAALMEIARILKSSGIAPKKTIIFIAFNGEEQFLYGSRYYANNPLYPLENATVINMDMVGSNGNSPLYIAGLSYNLNMDLTVVAKELGINAVAETVSVGSDQMPFNDLGIEAATIIHPDMNRIHTPLDTIDNIDEDRLKDVIMLVLSYIVKNAY